MTALAEKIGGGELDSPLAYAVSRRNQGIHQLVERAVMQKDVLLAYQPTVSAQSSEPAFYEGLIRILDEDHNILPAAEFMPVAESREIGRIIDCLSLEMGLRALHEHPSLRLSINMSARSIGYRRWMDVLNHGLSRGPTIAERLILEITESSAMLMPELVTVFMEDLHKRGICFALDDFGAGYTAFRYLKDFYFDILKIDGQFIRNIHEDVNNQVLTSALISIGKHFDMLTVAKAVEQPEEAAFLQAAGLDCLQGYYFGIPTTTPSWLSAEGIQAAS